jgi:putative polyhydroxyalkanoate system protein
MATIRYRRRHSVEPEVARAELRRLVQRFAEKYKFSAVWEGEDRAVISRRGVKGLVELRPGEILFNIRLSLLLTPFRTRIERGLAQEVQQALDEVYASKAC